MLNKKFNLLVVSIAFLIGMLFFMVFSSSSQFDKTTQSNVPAINVQNNSQVTEEKPEVEISSSRSLDLSGDSLDKLPSYVLSRTDLEELNISNNKLTGALPSEIGKLKKLKVLRASNNLMTGVPAEIGHLPDLEILDLSNNSLTGLPYELANLKKLKVLNLSGNDYSKQDLEIIKKGLPADVQIIL